MFNKKISRRQFLTAGLKSTACVACSAAAFGSLGSNLVFAQSPQGTGKIMVLVNFFGGIDGLNWVVPYSNSVYYDRRPNIAIPEAQVLKLNNEVGFHPAWKAIYDGARSENRVAVVQQVGYPNANHSHFESQDIWSFGRRTSNRTDGRGWVGRLSDLYFDSNYDVIGVGVGQSPDFSSDKPGSRPVLLSDLNNFAFSADWYSGMDSTQRINTAELNAFGPDLAGLQGKVQASNRKIYSTRAQFKQIAEDFKNKVEYPNNSLSYSLRDISKLIQASVGTQVFYTGVGGWDTHSNELAALNTNLTDVAAAVAAFEQDMKAIGKWDQVCLVFFSEFGRNCYENGTRGTDHGHGNNMVLIGGSVRGGVYGSTPSATDLRNEDVGYYIDFRSVFKTVIRDHLGLDPNPVFDEVIPVSDPGLGLFA